MTENILLEAFSIKKSYQITKHNKLEVLKGINLKIYKSEIAAIVGKSGAGKSTLLHILGALDTPDSGKLIYNDKNILNDSDKELANFRNSQIGFVFQFHHLLPEFTVSENIQIPAMINGNIKKDNLNELINLVGLSDRANHKPSEISGGEAQRAAIARALINSPNLILADEPTGNLDTDNAESVIDLIFRLRKQLKTTFIIVTHNPEFAQRCDRIIKMNDGVILE
jgi:lipoprotein-releasing system ATP-binding protein